QIHEEYFVKAAFSQKLGRKFINLIGCSSHKHWSLMLLQPGEERAKYACGDSFVALFVTGDTFFDFFKPKNGGRYRFSLCDGSPERLFGVAKAPSINAVHVQSIKRQAPRSGNSLSAQGFSATTHTCH